MNIMIKLTKKHMWANKRRTIMTILGVIVSVAMMTAVAIGTSSFKHYLQTLEYRRYGDWLVKYNNLDEKQVAALKGKSNIDYAFSTREYIYGIGPEFDTKYDRKPYLFLGEFTQDAMEKMHIHIKEGRLPEKEGEIAIPDHLKFSKGTSYQIGDKIRIERGHRYNQQFGADIMQGQNRGYVEDEEEFKCIDTKEYTITGVIQEPGFENYAAPGYTCVLYLDESTISASDPVSVSVMPSKVNRNLYKEAKQNAEEIGISMDELKYNTDVLTYYGITSDRSFNRLALMLEGILIVIIMVGSVSLIYNSFAISITERNKQYGMLSSVGATKQQKRNSVFYEAFIIGGIAIPLGVLAGLAGMAVTFRIVGPMIANNTMNNVALTLYLSVWSIVIAVLFSMTTILISAYIPAKRAGRISAIDAIRQTKDIKMSRKTVRTNKLVRRIFGLEGELALKNLKRNKKRFRALVFSLFISLVLFISVSSYVFYVKHGLEIAKGTADYHISVSFLDKMPSNQMYSDLTNLAEVSNSVDIKLLQSEFYIQKSYTVDHRTKQCAEALTKLYERYGNSTEDVNRLVNEDFLLGIDFVVLDPDAYDSYKQEVGYRSMGELQDDTWEGILVNRHSNQVGFSVLEADVLDTKQGDTIPIYRQDYKIKNDEQILTQQVDYKIKVAAVTEYLPMKIRTAGLDGNMTFVVSQDTMDEIVATIPEQVYKYTFEEYFFEVNEAANVDTAFKSILDEYEDISFGYYNVIAQRKKNQQMMLVVSIFAYGFIALISLICIANLCNTIRTSFILRRREFAMLKSVGMTPRAFHKMIQMESMFYGLKALLYGLPVSIFITVKIFKTVDENFMSEFIFPWLNYGIGIAAIFLVVGVSMRYASNKVKDETIIEGLKSEVQ